MKFNIIHGHQTVLYDTSKFKTSKEWIHLLHLLGVDLAEKAWNIEKIKIDRMKGNPGIPQEAWKKLNLERSVRLREWRIVADHIVAVYPKEISFTANKFMQLVRENHPEIYQDLFPIAASSPTKLNVSQEGKNNAKSE